MHHHAPAPYAAEGVLAYLANRMVEKASALSIQVGDIKGGGGVTLIFCVPFLGHAV